jgi:hypothetical protein
MSAKIRSLFLALSLCLAVFGALATDPEPVSAQLPEAGCMGIVIEGVPETC